MTNFWGQSLRGKQTIVETNQMELVLVLESSSVIGRLYVTVNEAVFVQVFNCFQALLACTQSSGDREDLQFPLIALSGKLVEIKI